MNPHHNTKITSKRHRQQAAVQLGLLGALTLSSTAHAGLLDIGPYSNQIETDAAIATQAIYEQLQPACGFIGINENVAVSTGRTGALALAPGDCTGDVLTVWNFVNEVVINADDIQSGINQPGRGSFGTLGRPNTLLLGRALQWCSGEEFTGLGSQASAFTGGQIANLATRIAGLRLGSSGLRIASNGRHFGVVPYGGGASGDDMGSGWSTFINGDYTAGDHQATARENAFDIIGRNFTAGVDKRLNQRWVAGAIFGHQSQNLDFVDVLPGVTVNVVDASTTSKGNSLLPYVLYQGDNWYFNASVGYQTMDFEMNRRTNYGSGAVAPTPITHDTLSTSSVSSKNWSSYESLGYSWRPAAKFIIEPSLSADWRHITIDAFTEDDINNTGFNFAVDEQRINSLEVIPALRMQYSFTPRFGVWTPYVDAQWHKQLRDQSRTIRAQYAGIVGLVSDDAKFSIHTDAPDDSYQVYTAGFSAVLSGSQRGGLQVYGNYRWYHQLQNYSLHTISAGMRYEF